MNGIKFYRSPWKAVKLLALATPFVLIGIWLVERSLPGSRGFYAAWIAILFFGLGIAVGLFHLFDKRPQIVINENGLWARYTKQGLIEWEFITDAYLMNVYGQEFIPLILDKSFKIKSKHYKWAEWINKRLGAQRVNIHVDPIQVDPIKFAVFIRIMIQADEATRKEIVHTLPYRYAMLLPEGARYM